MKKQSSSLAVRFLIPLFLSICVICAISGLGFAQGNGLGKFRTALDIPSQDAPTCLKPSSGLVIKCYDGNIYAGAGAVAAGSSAAVSLTATDSMSTCPTDGACNFIYADTGGTLHITTALATALGSGFSNLYYVQTSGAKVTAMQTVWRTTTPLHTFTLSTGAITPAASSAAIQTAAQAFTLTGLVSGDQVQLVSQPAPTSLCPAVSVRATGTNSLSIYFTTLTAAACTPAAGTYVVQVIR
jgi:hypothetical protein